MIENLDSVCSELMQSEEDSKKLLAIDDMDDMYEYFSSKVPGLTKEEFDDFMVSVLERYFDMQNSSERLSEEDVENVAGGLNFLQKAALLGFVGCLVVADTAGTMVERVHSGANSIVQTTKSAVQTTKSTFKSAKRSLSDKISSTYKKTADWVKKNPAKVAAGAAITLGTVVAGVAAGSALRARHNDSSSKTVGYAYSYGAGTKSHYDSDYTYHGYSSSWKRDSSNKRDDSSSYSGYSHDFKNSDKSSSRSGFSVSSDKQKKSVTSANLNRDNMQNVNKKKSDATTSNLPIYTVKSDKKNTQAAPEASYTQRAQKQEVKAETPNLPIYTVRSDKKNTQAAPETSYTQRAQKQETKAEAPNLPIYTVKSDKKNTQAAPEVSYTQRAQKQESKAEAPNLPIYTVRSDKKNTQAAPETSYTQRAQKQETKAEAPNLSVYTVKDSRGEAQAVSEQSRIQTQKQAPKLKTATTDTSSKGSKVESKPVTVSDVARRIVVKGDVTPHKEKVEKGKLHSGDISAALEQMQIIEKNAQKKSKLGNGVDFEAWQQVLSGLASLKRVLKYRDQEFLSNFQNWRKSLESKNLPLSDGQSDTLNGTLDSIEKSLEG